MTQRNNWESARAREEFIEQLVANVMDADQAGERAKILKAGFLASSRLVVVFANPQSEHGAFQGYVADLDKLSSTFFPRLSDSDLAWEIVQTEILEPSDTGTRNVDEELQPFDAEFPGILWNGDTGVVV